MSKNKATQYAALSHQEEYAIIKKDLYKVLALNLFYLALVLVVYFTDQKSHYLVRVFGRFLNF